MSKIPATDQIKTDATVVVIAALITLLSLVGGVVMWVFLAALTRSGSPLAIGATGGAEVAIVLLIATLIVRARIALAWPLVGILIGFLFAPIILLSLYLALGGDLNMD